ncbi:tetratricopeptide repeat protein [Streptomyces sp. NPDC003832]
MDDARSAEHVRPLLPAGPGSRVLVTGRQRLLGLDADRRFTVEPLSTDNALALLRELLGAQRADREPEAALELAQRCGGLPLALRIATSRLQHRPSWTLTLLAGRLSDGERGLSELRAGDRSVEAAFTMSYDQLTPALQRGFRALGRVPTTDFDALSLAAMLDTSRERAEDVLEDLVDTSLLQQPHPGRYRLHDLVRAHARHLAAEAPDQAAADLNAVLHLYTSAGRMAGDEGDRNSPTGPDVGAFRSRRDASAWLRAAGGELADLVAHAAAAEEFDHACRIAEALVEHLVRQGQYHECRTALELALPYADRATDPRMPAALRNCLGMIDIYQGRHRLAHTRFTEALRHCRSHDDLRERARAVTGTGIAHWSLGELDDAVTHLEKAVSLTARTDDDWLIGAALCSLGAIRSLQGRHEEAFELNATALAVAEKSGLPRAISNVLCFAADTYVAAGHHIQAQHLLRRAADFADEAEDVPLRAASLSRLATVEHLQGSLHSAVDTHHKALATLTPHTNAGLEMKVRIRLGSTYAAAGRHAEARHEYQTALSLPGASDHPLEQSLARQGLNGTHRPTDEPTTGSDES